MPDKDAFAKRERALEDQYFQKKDRELVEKLRQEAASEETRRGLGETTGIRDASVLAELEELGFTPETVALLPFVPIVEVAWAEQGVSDAERNLIVDLARARGIEADGAADAQLEAWLTHQPDGKVFAGAARLIRALFDARPEGQGDIDTSDLVRYCEQVADASGGFLSLRRISPEERALLGRISDELKVR